VTERVVVVGASGFGRESLDVLEAMQSIGADIEIAGVIDDAPSKTNLQRLRERGVDYLGTTNDWLSQRVPGEVFVLGIGSPRVRRMLVEKLELGGAEPFTTIHPTVSLGSQSVIGKGAVICSGAVVSTNVKLGRHVHVNPNVTIGHDSELDDFVSVNPAAVISGDVHLATGVLVGAAATVLQQLTVAEDALIGAGALVTRSVPPSVVVKGVPGRW